MTALAILGFAILITLLTAVFSKGKPKGSSKSPEEIKRQNENEDRREREKGIRQLQDYGAERHAKNPNKDDLTDDLPF